MIKSLVRLLKRYNILSEVLVLDIAEVAQPLPESVDRGGVIRAG